MVRQMRMPCYKLAAKFQLDDMIERFLHSGRSGFYFSVEREGDVSVDDSFEAVSQEPHGITIAEMNVLVAKDRYNHKLIEKALATPALPDDSKDLWPTACPALESLPQIALLTIEVSQCLTMRPPMIVEALHRVANQGESLSRAESRAVMTDVLAGKCTDAQIAALLVALRIKGETVEEIVGFAEAIRAAAAPLPIERAASSEALDVSGTGRDALAESEDSLIDPADGS